MRKIIPSLLLIMLCILLSISPAWSKTLKNHGKIWDLFTIEKTLIKDKPWRYHFDLETRFINFNEDPVEQILIRNQLGAAITKRFTIWIGYVFAPIFPTERREVLYEQRIEQQWDWIMHKDEHFNFAYRSRLEERTRNDSNQWSMRLRQRFTLSWPELIDHRYTLLFYDELFFNLNHPRWVSSQTLSENRLFIGLQLPIKKGMNFIAGYLNQLVLRRPNQNDFMNHIFYVAINFD